MGNKYRLNMEKVYNLGLMEQNIMVNGLTIRYRVMGCFYMPIKIHMKVISNLGKPMVGGNILNKVVKFMRVIG